MDYCDASEHRYCIDFVQFVTHIEGLKVLRFFLEMEYFSVHWLKTQLTVPDWRCFNKLINLLFPVLLQLLGQTLS